MEGGGGGGAGGGVDCWEEGVGIRDFLDGGRWEGIYGIGRVVARQDDLWVLWERGIGRGLTNCSHGFDHVVFFFFSFDGGEEGGFRGKRRIFLVNGRAMRDEEDLVVFLTNVCVV